MPEPPDDEEDLVARVRDKVSRLNEIREQEREALADLDATLRAGATVIHRMGGPAEFTRKVGEEVIGRDRVRKTIGPRPR